MAPAHKVSSVNGGEARKGTEEWFRSWFGEDYLRLYPHRDQREAAEAVRLYLSPGRPSGRSLDLACGAGRHLRELRRAGVEAVGLDLSMTLLKRARRASTPSFQLVRADMRELPFRDGAFSALTSFFTSFGYFDTEAEDRTVACEMRRVLIQGGRYLIDYLNATLVKEALVPAETTEIDGRPVRLTRSIEAGAVVKRIEFENMEGGAPKAYMERVRLYSAEELEAMLVEAGLQPTDRFGDYEGAPFRASSQRLLLAGRAR